MRDMDHKRAYDREREKRRPKRHRRGQSRNREYHRAWNDAHPDYAKTWRAAHPNYRPPSIASPTPEAKVKAKGRALLNRARQKGLVTVLPCEMCGSVRTEAHHPFGYEEPMALAVWWLCPPHHKAMHSAIFWTKK